ncbi:MAG: ABC transporter permease [Methanosarcinaceae archaeon]|nr:ABC transporter permease [Methanosarcinaceae archaeon]MDD4497381.1 ABC transporter permease [Methanosarcinaceae archaeon]
MIQGKVVYVLWRREMIKYFRAKSRVVGAIAMPAFMLIFQGMGFRRVEFPGLPDSIGYFQYLVPGIIGMTLLFTAAYAGMSVIMDKQFGFLKEVMVTPASRISIVLGMISGSATTSILQALIIMMMSVFLGFRLPFIPAILFSVVIMVLISTTFINIGLILSSVLKDFHGFSTIINFIAFPLFLLSGALFPISNLPAPIRILSYFDPLTYGVDALRGILIGYCEFPIVLDVCILLSLSVLMVCASGYFFRRAEMV